MLYLRQSRDVDGHEVAASLPVDSSQDLLVLSGEGREEVAWGCVGAAGAFSGVSGGVGQGSGDHIDLANGSCRGGSGGTVCLKRTAS